MEGKSLWVKIFFLNRTKKTREEAAALMRREHEKIRKGLVADKIDQGERDLCIAKFECMSEKEIQTFYNNMSPEQQAEFFEKSPVVMDALKTASHADGMFRFSEIRPIELSHFGKIDKSYFPTKLFLFVTDFNPEEKTFSSVMIRGKDLSEATIPETNYLAVFELDGRESKFVGVSPIPTGVDLPQKGFFLTDIKSLNVIYRHSEEDPRIMRPTLVYTLRENELQLLNIGNVLYEKGLLQNLEKTSGKIK